MADRKTDPSFRLRLSCHRLTVSNIVNLWLPASRCAVLTTLTTMMMVGPSLVSGHCQTRTANEQPSKKILLPHPAPNQVDREANDAYANALEQIVRTSNGPK